MEGTPSSSALVSVGFSVTDIVVSSTRRTGVKEAFLETRDDKMDFFLRRLSVDDTPIIHIFLHNYKKTMIFYKCF